LSETRKYRRFTPQQKLELVMASWRGERSIAELCREHDISESLLRRWREQILEAGMERFAAGEQRSAGVEQGKKIAELERALGRKTYELEIAGKLLRDWEWACASPGLASWSPRATGPRRWRASLRSAARRSTASPSRGGRRQRRAGRRPMKSRL
jgi:transposase